MVTHVEFLRLSIVITTFSVLAAGCATPVHPPEVPRIPIKVLVSNSNNTTSQNVTIRISDNITGVPVAEFRAVLGPALGVWTLGVVWIDKVDSINVTFENPEPFYRRIGAVGDELDITYIVGMQGEVQFDMTNCGRNLTPCAS